MIKTVSAVYQADNLDVLASIPDQSIDMVYIDPPFNTGKTQSRRNAKMTKSELHGDRKGFGDNQYKVLSSGEEFSYQDSYGDLYLDFLRERVEHIHRILKPSGCFYLHLDWREAAYAKVFVGDPIFGRENFLNEVIWAYDYGAKPKKRWPTKHDNILVWVKNMGNHFFGIEDIDRIPYMAPNMVSEEKAAKGKLPTDCFWLTIVSPTGKEKTGYPTQKPLTLLERIIRASCPKGGVVLDCFAGSGTTGEAAILNDRSCILVDSNPDSFRVMKKRLLPYRELGHEIKFFKKKTTEGDNA